VTVAVRLHRSFAIEETKVPRDGPRACVTLRHAVSQPVVDDQIVMIEVVLNDRLGKKIRVKCKCV